MLSCHDLCFSPVKWSLVQQGGIQSWQNSRRHFHSSDREEQIDVTSPIPALQLEPQGGRKKRLSLLETACSSKERKRDSRVLRIVGFFLPSSLFCCRFFCPHSTSLMERGWKVMQAQLIHVFPGCSKATLMTVSTVLMLEVSKVRASLWDEQQQIVREHQYWLA